MNKEQAIKIRSCFANGVGFKELADEETNVLVNALAKELNNSIEKQIAKKPIKDREQNIRYTSSYSCPTCGGGFSGTGIVDYCYHCGQKLEWNVEE